MLTGFLEHAAGKDVNAVNVMAVAENLGILVEERKTSHVKDYGFETQLLRVLPEIKSDALANQRFAFGDVRHVVRRQLHAMR